MKSIGNLLRRLIYIAIILGYTITSIIYSLSSASTLESYSREKFRHWIDKDSDCQNTKTEIIIRDSTTAKLSPNSCTVLSSTLLDPYSGEIINYPEEFIDVDHIVPLKEAWASGASTWTSAKREAFANDPNNLLAVSAHLNRQKGSKDPSLWIPPNKAYRCTYLKKWAAIKFTYSLDSDIQESVFIKQNLKTC